MTPRILIISLFFGLTLVPIGWNKFDIVRHADLLYGLGVLLPLLAIFSFRKIKKNLNFSFESRFEILTLVAFFALSVTSFYTSTIQNYGWSEVLVTGSGITLYFLAKNFEEKEKKFLAVILTVSALVSVGAGIYFYLTTPEMRISGLFFDYDKKTNFWPNTFALFLLAVWPLAVKAAENFENKFIKIIIPSLLFTGLFLTFSRAAMIAFFIQLALFFFMSRKKKCAPVIGIILLTGILIFTIQQIRSLNLETNSFINKFSFQGTEKQTSLMERKDFMKGAASLAMDRPFFGYGPGTFRFVYPEIQQDFLATSDHPHNFFLKIWMENGTPAAVALLLFLLLVAWKQIKNPSLYTVAITGVIAHSLVDYNLNFLTNALIFWVLLAFINSNEKTEKKEADKRWQKIPIITMIALLSISALYEGYLAIKLRSEIDYEFYKSSQFPRDFWASRNTERDLEYHLELNPLDAFAWHTLGKIQEKNAKIAAAYQSYKKAVEANPANFFMFYLDYFRTAKLTGIKDPDREKIRKDAIKFLTSYPEKVRQNIHYTAQSGNIDAALKLANLLNMSAVEEQIKQAHIEWIREKAETVAKKI